jgi:hypothetical protein
MRRILLTLFAAVGLALGSGAALAQHNGGGHSGGGHGSGGWHGGGGHGGHGGWHGGSHFSLGIGFPGFYWGPGWGYPYYAGYPYYSSYPYYAAYPYYADEPYAYEPGPSTYIQRDMGSAPSSSAPVGENQYSYYCPDPAGYYPQLQSCPKGWLKVVPDAGPRPRTR